MSQTYQTAAEAAAEVRSQLKKLYGITSRQVSIRAKTFSMGSSIDIEINDPAVDIREVRNAADCKEKIDRCQYTGEILSGGNRYLSVKYGRKAADAVVAANGPAIAQLLAVIPEPGASVCGPEVVIDGRTVYLARRDGFMLVIFDAAKSCGRPAWIPDPGSCPPDVQARAVAEAILSLRGGDA